MAKSIEEAVKNVPKTVTIDVEAESWSKGYQAATQDCATYSSSGQIHDTYYVVPYYMTLLREFSPLIILLIFLLLFLFFLKRAVKRQRTYFEKYDLSMERQKQALEGIETTNKLLAEISQKLDKR